LLLMCFHTFSMSIDASSLGVGEMDGSTVAEYCRPVVVGYLHQP